MPKHRHLKSPTPAKTSAKIKKALTPEKIAEIVAEIPKRVAAQKADEQERRTLSGKHAPPKGWCHVCGGDVVAHVAFTRSDRIGGSPPQGHIAGWHCVKCKLMYYERPVRGSR